MELVGFIKNLVAIVPGECPEGECRLRPLTGWHAWRPSSGEANGLGENKSQDKSKTTADSQSLASWRSADIDFCRAIVSQNGKTQFVSRLNISKNANLSLAA